jgi:PAS domain S-box-containing protein
MSSTAFIRQSLTRQPGIFARTFGLAWLILLSLLGVAAGLWLVNDRLASLLGGGCLLITGGAYLLARQLTRPILRLKQRTEQLVRENPEVQIPLITNDEIADLAATFTRMSTVLHDMTVSKEYFNSVLENMSECLIVTTLAGAIQSVNQATLNLLAYTEAELLQQPLTKLFGQEDPASLQELLATTPKRDQEKILVAKTGEQIPVVFSIARMHSPHQFQGLVCVALDIRSRKRAEYWLEQAYQEIQQTQVQLIQTAKLASIGELAAGVAHELNQPLMVIRTTAQMMQRAFQKQTLTLPDVATHAQSIERNTGRMMHIINHLRTFSRQAPTQFTTVNLNQVVTDMLLLIGEQLRVRNIVVATHFAPDLPTVEGDANQLEQVVLNLVLNAKDAMLSVPQPNHQLTLMTRCALAPANTVELLVQDSGCGIPAEYLDKIFDPFFTTKEVGKGTGLGLSISYGIIKEHHGEILVAETGPTGTTFLLRFPGSRK